MEVIKILAFGIVGAMASVFVKQHKPEYTFAIQVAVTVIIAGWSISYIRSIADMLLGMGGQYGLDNQLIIIPLKALGISVLTQMSSDLCRDSGNSAIAEKMDFAGRVIIVAMSVPILRALLQFAAELLGR